MCGATLPASAEARSAVHELAEGWGEVLTRKAEDMREQHRVLTATTRAVGVVCDTSCDLPDDLLDEALPPHRERLRMGVVHADVPAVADEVRGALARRYQPYEILVSPVTAVLAAHCGPGAWGVLWQLEDGAAGAGNKSPVRPL